MRKKFLASLLVLCMFVSLLAACGNKTATVTPAPTQAPTPSATGTPADENAKVTFTDSAGRKVEVPANITRIAPSGAMAQMVIFALAPEKFVGLASKWSPESEQFINTKHYSLPVLGQFYGTGDLNMESIAAADPQVIIDIGESKDTIVEDMDGIMNQVGIPTIHIEATTTTMADAYRMLGKLLGMEEEAEVLAKYCDEVYNNTLSIIDKVGEDKKAKLLYCLGDNGLNVIAKGSFHAEIINIISDNLAVVDEPSSKGSGNPVDMEQILLWNPDVIIFAPGSAYKTVADDKAWQDVSAIKNKKYYEAPGTPYNWMGFPPSVNRYMGMLWLTKILYPEEAKYDLYEETARYYKLFYHCDLTKEQYDSLMANAL
ncbi:corrinoid ABC transporter substrate-binding protein [Oxobacter pfennigii]|uniref:Corrinoid ABC transporter substrate-binding protein n=1 Tax=Oxobacter pfennigii TaxID=36849 RepID=A0A0P8W4U1_9CLOT|nr:ABC transporter substrate-binding protein [Oxobacter pfennigii]KPU42541.1 corrinoid ABC transporter substrate-binding protein [Oxobacter pfennigii]